MLSSALILVASLFIGIHAESDKSMVRQGRPLLSSFDEITVDGNCDVFLTQLPDSDDGQSRPSLEIEATADVHSQILSDISDGTTLSVRIPSTLNVVEPPKIFIKVANSLSRCSISNFKDGSNTKFSMKQQGTSSTSLELNVFSFEAFIEGTGDTEMAGQVRDQAIFRIQGTRDVDASKLTCKRAIVDIQGTSNLAIVATEDIEITAAGVSEVSYQLPAGKQPSKLMKSGLATISRVS